MMPTLNNTTLDAKNTLWWQKAEHWAQENYFEPQDLQQLRSDLSQALTQVSIQNEIKEKFSGELELGTAGLRGIVGFGSAYINKYNVRKATHALALAIKEYFPAPQQNTWTVCISSDSRLSSYEFLQETLRVLSAHQIRCFYFTHPTATPILSYAVRFQQAQAGIMITASHNPKNYNGYKIYWQDGGQVTGPYDQTIMQHYAATKSWSDIPLLSCEKAHELKWAQAMPEEVETSYYQKVKQSVLNSAMIKSSGEQLSIIYTPLHGTGAKPIEYILKEIGFKSLHLVPEQAKPDGHFPTLNYPNPEDPHALDLAKKLMQKLDADVVIGSDPDTDRMGVLVRASYDQGTMSEPIFLTGNEIASFMLYYKLSAMQELKLLTTQQKVVFKSVVTSELQRAICEKFSVHIYETLTGFKWMARALKIAEEKNPQLQFIFASEESFGTMPNAFVRDKDGVAAAALFSEAVLFYKLKNKSVPQVLQEIYQQCGYFKDQVLNFDFPGVDGKKIMQEILKYFSVAENLTQELDALLCMDFFDQQTRVEFHPSSSTIKTKQVPLDFAKTPMMGLHFTTGTKLYLRPSGTEPKIKFYLMLTAGHGHHKEQQLKMKKIEEKYVSFIKKIIQQFRSGDKHS